MTDQLQELRTLIVAELDLCDITSTPTVCAMNTPDNQEKLVDLVQKHVLENKGTTIGQAILEVERSYNINMIHD